MQSETITEDTTVPSAAAVAEPAADLVADELVEEELLVEEVSIDGMCGVY
jgi:mycofactocin precursor